MNKYENRLYYYRILTFRRNVSTLEANLLILNDYFFILTKRLRLQSFNLKLRILYSNSTDDIEAYGNINIHSIFENRFSR